MYKLELVSPVTLDIYSRTVNAKYLLLENRVIPTADNSLIMLKRYVKHATTETMSKMASVLPLIPYANYQT